MPGQIYWGPVADLPKETRHGGKYHRTGLLMDHANLTFVWLEPGVFGEVPLKEGEVPKMHTHPFDQFMFILSGELRQWAGDEGEFLLKAGDFCYIPRDVPHAGQTAKDQPCALVEMFAPIRTSYLYVAEHQLAHGAVPREADGSRVDSRTTAEIRAATMADSTYLP